MTDMTNMTNMTKLILQAIKSSAHGSLIRVGLDLRRLRPDRVVLERTIFPYLLEHDAFGRLLFVGCAWYTRHYPWLFRSREFWTMEFDPALARFGGTRHIVDTCERVADHFPTGHLDAVICNGVYGFGLDDRAGLERSVRGFHRVLRRHGLLLFGWNNVPEHDPVRIDRLAIFDGFGPAASPFGVARHEVPESRNRHTYDFLSRI